MVMEMADDDDAKVEVSKLRKSVIEELKMHNSFAKVCIVITLLQYCVVLRNVNPHVQQIS